MRKCLLRALVVCNVVLYGIAWSGPASAGEDEGAEKERVAIFEVAVTGEREISEGTSHVGPAVGVEIEPIEGWLEIELGASTYRSHGATNWELELPFKKPFRLSDTIEIMPGIGPTWTHTTQTGQRPSVWGGEAVVDLFFWRSKRFGWYLEPSYGATFASGHAKSLAVTAGLFFAVP